MGTGTDTLAIWVLPIFTWKIKKNRNSPPPPLITYGFSLNTDECHLIFWREVSLTSITLSGVFKTHSTCLGTAVARVGNRIEFVKPLKFQDKAIAVVKWSIHV